MKWTLPSKRTLARALAVSWLLCAGRPVAAGELSFDKALEILQNTNESLLAARMETRRQKEQQAAARGLYFPKVTASGRYTRIDAPIDIDLNDIRTLIATLHGLPEAALPSFILPVQDQDFYRLAASVTWPVYTGGKITAANRAAKDRAENAAARLDGTSAGLVTELTQRYFGLRLATAVVDIRQQVLDGMAAHLFQAEKLEENGMIPRAEKLHAAVAHAEAERQALRAAHDADIARSALKNTLSLQTPVTPTSPLFIVEELAPLAEYQAAALAANPVLRQIDAQQDLARQAYIQEKAAYRPDVFVFGTRELYTDDLTLLDPEWAVGLGAQLTLFDGFARRHRTRAARLQEKRVAYLGAKARRDLSTLVEKRYRELRKALELHQALKTSRGFAGEYLRIRKRAFEEGLATSIDVVDAELSLSRVKIEQLSALYQFDLALARLLEACGQSSELETYRTRAVTEDIF